MLAKFNQGNGAGAQVKTILNWAQKFKGFVYKSIRWALDGANPLLEVEVVARSNSRGRCKVCGKAAPGYVTQLAVGLYELGLLRKLKEKLTL